MESVPTVKIDWYYNGQLIAGAHSTTLVIPEVNSNSVGTYWAQASSAGGTTASQPAVVSVRTEGEGGQLKLSNQIPEANLDAPIYDVDGTNKVSGAAFLVQLYAGATANDLEPIGAAVPFLTAENSGYFSDDVLRVLPGSSAGGQAVAQIRVWESSFGASYAEAQFNSGKVGVSQVLNVTVGTEAAPGILAGLTSFSLGQPPKLDAELADTTLVEGIAGSLSASISGTLPWQVQWYFEGNAITEGTSAELKFATVRTTDAGKYHFTVANDFGVKTSRVAMVTVFVPDRMPPQITIISPQPGSTDNENITLKVSISDDDAISSAFWEFNGESKGSLPYDGTNYVVSGIVLEKGQHIFRVMAADPTGNSSTSEVSVVYAPGRILWVKNADTQQEGAKVRLPIELFSSGEVGAATVHLKYDTNYLTLPELQWSDEIRNAFVQVTTDRPGIVRAAFALSGTALTGGTNKIAEISFRSRSVPESLRSPVEIDFLEFYRVSGDPIAYGKESHNGEVIILKRRFKGDVNANNMLDVGDASAIMSLVLSPEDARSWDISGNDLNRNELLDSGDVLKVLRTVVGLDAQPVEERQSFLLAETSEARVELRLDRQKAASGEKVKVSVLVENNILPVSGASLRINYPIEALKLDDAQAYKVGVMVPASGLAAVWNLSPAQSDFSIQNGSISVAMSTAGNWFQSNGILAELTFTVQETAASKYKWVLSAEQIQIGNSLDLISLNRTEASYTARDASPPKLEAAFHIEDGFLEFPINGEIGASYLIEISEDLVAWRVLSTLENSTGKILVRDTVPAEQSQRFYRATQVE